MADHLPEYLPPPPPYAQPEPLNSVTGRLVTRTKKRVIQEAEFNYRRGVQAAREAVAALAIAYDERQNDLPVVGREDALAAIDALKENK